MKDVWDAEKKRRVRNLAGAEGMREWALLNQVDLTDLFTDTEIYKILSRPLIDVTLLL